MMRFSNSEIFLFFVDKDQILNFCPEQNMQVNADGGVVYVLDFLMKFVQICFLPDFFFTKWNNWNWKKLEGLQSNC